MKKILMAISMLVFIGGVVAQKITTIAGGGSWPSEGGSSTLAQMSPYGVVLKSNGDLYYSDLSYHVVRKVSPNGLVTTIAGKDTAGYRGDGGDARQAFLSSPYGLAMNTAGDLFICDRNNNRIRKVNTSGIITTVAGNGTNGFSGDGGAAVSAQLSSPNNVYVDANNNLIISDYGNFRVRKVDPQGVITTIAGGGNWPSEGSAASLAEYGTLSDVYLSSKGDLYVTDLNTHSVRKISANGVVTTVAGNGARGFSGDGGPGNKAALNTPYGVAVDLAGNVYIADASNGRIRKVNTLGIISTFSGKDTIGYNGDTGPATSIFLNFPTDITTDANGNVFIADRNNQLIRKVDINGNLTTIAGNRSSGFSGDGGNALQASFSFPSSLAVDASNNLYVGDYNNSRIRKISANGIITTIGGNGNLGYTGDGMQATSTALYLPWGLTVDAQGNVFFMDYGNNRVRRIAINGVITTVAGNGNFGFSGDGGTATSATLGRGRGVAVDGSGNIYIPDGSNYRVRRVNTSGIISTYSGTGNYGVTGNPQDGIAANQAYQVFPYQLTGDASGNIYFGEDRYRIRKISIDGVISTVAGNGAQGYSGDGGQAKAASINVPFALKIDNSGSLIFSDYYRVRRVQPNGIISTIAGNGGSGYAGDGGSATSAQFSIIYSLDVDPSGNIYLADRSNNRIRRFSAGGLMNTYAGTGTVSYSGDGGASTAAQISNPGGITVDGSGNIYFVDRGNNRIRRISNTGVITTAAGNGSTGYSGDGGNALGATFNGITDVAVDAAGNIYISDRNNFRVRKVTIATGIVTTIAGNGSSTFFGDGGSAVAAGLGSPTGIAVDASGNIYISDERYDRVRRVSTTGIITTYAGNGTNGFTGDGGVATSAALANPQDLIFDASGNLFIADRDNQRIRRVAPSGIITTIAGGGSYYGDGGAATFAFLNYPTGLSVDGSGNIYISDQFANRIRRVSTNGIITTYAGNGRNGFSGDDGPAIAARINNAERIAVDASGNLYIADASNNRIRKVTPCATVPSAPSLTTSNGTTSACQNTGFAIRSAASGLHQWYRDGVPLSDSISNEIKPIFSGEYAVRIADANACASVLSSGVSITIGTAPLAPQFSNLAVCKDTNPVDLSKLAIASIGNTLRWYGTDSTGGNASANAPIVSTATVGSTSYYVTQRNSTGCESPRVKIVISINGTPSAPAVTDISLCNSASASPLTATAVASNTLNWYGTNASGGTPSLVAPIPGTSTIGTIGYYVSQTAPGGCESIRSKINVTVNALPSASPGVSAITLCQSSSAVALTATASSGNTLSWYGTSAVGGTSSAAAPVPSTTNVGIIDYYVSERNASGCDGPRSKLSVSIISSPAAPQVINLQYCRDVTATALTAVPNSGNVISWYGTSATGGSASAIAPVPVTTAAGVTDYYVVQRSSSGGCESARSKLTVTVNDLPALPATSNIGYCKDAAAISLSATASSGNTLLWYGANITGGTPTSIAPVPSTTAVGSSDFYVSQRNNATGCEGGRSKITVTIATLPALPEVSLAKLCQGVSTSVLKATAASGNTLLWYTTVVGGNGTSTAPTPSTASVGSTDYFVSQVSGGGCIGPRAVLTVTVNAVPSAPAVSAIGLCQQSTATALTATASAGNTLNWYGNNATGGTASTTPPVPPTTALGASDYYVSQFNINTGCESPRSKLTVTINNLPGKANISRDGTGNLVSDISNGNQWFKDGAAIAGATSQSYKPTEVGNYTVKVTQNGCIGVVSETYYYLITSVANLTATDYRMQVFPNPSIGNIWVDLGERPAASVTLRILTTQGKEVYRTTTKKQLTQLAWSGLVSGTYFIEASGDLKSKVLRAVKN